MGLAHHLGPVLVMVEDKNDRLSLVDQPPQPRGELWAQLDRERSGDVPAGEGGDGPHVDDRRAGCDAVAHGLQIEAGQGRLFGAKDGGAESVHLAQTREVGRIGAHAFE